MKGERNFGTYHSTPDNPYEVEKYGNRTVSEPQRIESNLTRMVTAGLDLPSKCSGRSRLWHFEKEPWQFYSDSGHLLFSLGNIKFSVWHMDDFENAFRGVMLLRFDWTDGVVSEEEEGRNREVPMFVEIEGRENNTPAVWDLGRLAVGRKWVRRPVTFMQEFDPEDFSRIRGCRWCIFPRRERMYEC